MIRLRHQQTLTQFKRRNLTQSERSALKGGSDLSQMFARCRPASAAGAGRGCCGTMQLFHSFSAASGTSGAFMKPRKRSDLRHLKPLILGGLRGGGGGEARCWQVALSTNHCRLRPLRRFNLLYHWNQIPGLRLVSLLLRPPPSAFISPFSSLFPSSSHSIFFSPVSSPPPSPLPSPPHLSLCLTHSPVTGILRREAAPAGSR